jgi:signal transduction histidine kinase
MNMYSTIKEGNTWHGEIKNRAKDESYYWVATTIAPLKNEDRKVEGYLEVAVTDTGTGIDEKNLESLFRIESKISKIGTDNERGSGLGLILCKEFIEKQGGKIWATSELGKGSRFTFSLLTKLPDHSIL